MKRQTLCPLVSAADMVETRNFPITRQSKAEDFIARKIHPSTFTAFATLNRTVAIQSVS